MRPPVVGLGPPGALTLHLASREEVGQRRHRKLREPIGEIGLGRSNRGNPSRWRHNRMIPPDAQRDISKRDGAPVVEVKGESRCPTVCYSKCSVASSRRLFRRA
jgi:hypothetical protein